MRTILTVSLFLAACLAGCVPMERTSTIDQRQRENVGQRATSEFASAVQPNPLNVTIPTKDGPIIINQPLPSSLRAKAAVSESSDSMAAGSSEWSEAVPLFAKIIGLALGLGLLALVIFAIIRYVRQNPAVDAAWAEASKIGKTAIEKVTAAMHATEDPAKKAGLQTALNEMNAAHTETLT